MKIYQVGGSVRDIVMGIERSADRDFVVVNGTEEEFLKKFPDARKVGASFPVFLVNGEEYAFARKEKKVSPGYRGFEVVFNTSITLEEDLKRRDITINAMALDLETSEIIDPYGGIKDIERKKIVHITDSFAEDPLRVYRVARFGSVFPDFSIDPSTILLMKKLKKELKEISVERVWTECCKALSGTVPARFFEILKECEVLDIHFAEIESLIGVPAGPKEFHPGDNDTFDHTMKALRRLSNNTGGNDPVLVFSMLCHDLGKGLTDPDNYPHHHDHDKTGVKAVKDLCGRLKTPAIYSKSAEIVSRYHLTVGKIKELRPANGIKVLQEIKNFPAGGIAGFLKVVHSDSGRDIAEVEKFIKKVIPSLKEKLPEKWKDLGRKSGELLLQIRAEKYKELKELYNAEER